MKLLRLKKSENFHFRNVNFLSREKQIHVHAKLEKLIKNHVIRNEEQRKANVMLQSTTFEADRKTKVKPCKLSESVKQKKKQLQFK